jgi:photosystem II stability/assembly factor-like uncharacterized protein
MWLAVDEGAINSSFRQGGEIYTSIDNGNNWVAKPSAGIRNWHRVAMSADGQKLLASEDFGQVFLSTDGASSWAPLTIETEKGKFISDVACSADGVTIVVCTANSGTELPSGKIFISSDSGITWVERSPPPETDDLQQWKDLAISSDGMKIFVVASLGYVYSSVNQGQNWTAHKTSSGEDSLKLEWRAISCSSDGLRVAACACNQWIFTAE